MKLKIHPAVLQAKFEDEQLLVHSDTGRFFRLNVTAGRLYELLKDGNSLETAREKLLAEFDVAPDALDAELSRLIASMKAEELLVEDRD